MCGVGGIFAFASRFGDAERSQLALMSARMACRGPDGNGQWIDADSRVALAHRRLSIIDVSDRASQPMVDDATGNVISFNGEIYNFGELQRDLKAAGHRFKSESDTEVLLKLYAEHGAAMVQRLRGMFAFVLWDAARRELVVARDPFGVKPLYYSLADGVFHVASEVKALLATRAVDRTVEPAGHAGFFLWGNVPEPFTLYRGIRALPSGSTMTIREHSGPAGIAPYASVAGMIRDVSARAPTLSREEAVRHVAEKTRESVRYHLVADVDVGIFLSSGLDSNIIAAMAAPLSGRLRTVTLGFEEFRGTPADETILAERAAAAIGASHHTAWISRHDFETALPALLDRMDQPSIDGVNSWFVAKAAHDAGLKVALSGIGGDELFGGYSGFLEIPRLNRVMRRVPFAPLLGRAVRKLSSGLVLLVTSPKYSSIFEYGSSFGSSYMLRRALFLPWELAKVLGPELAEEGLRALHTQSLLDRTIAGIGNEQGALSALEATWYMRSQLLRDADWAGMAHSVEVRVPFVDWQLWRDVIGTVCTAHVSKSALAAAMPQPFPDAILNRRKTGFSVPVREWRAEQGDPARAERGLRGWARHVYAQAT